MTQQYPPQQPTPPRPPEPPKKRGIGRIVAVGCAGVVALFAVVAVIAAVAAGGDPEDSGGSTSGGASASGKDNRQDEADTKKAQEGPVKIAAKRTTFAKSVLAGDGDYTSVLVTVTNDGDETIGVNPLYFTLTDTDGTKHTVELGADEREIGAVDLAPGENISGTVTGKGAFTARYVTYTDGLLGDPIRADVS